MYNSLDYYIQDPKTVVAGDPSRYGVFHNRGTRHVPMRAFLTIDSRSDLEPLYNWNPFTIDFENNMTGQSFGLVQGTESVFYG